MREKQEVKADPLTVLMSKKWTIRIPIQTVIIVFKAWLLCLTSNNQPRKNFNSIRGQSRGHFQSLLYVLSKHLSSERECFQFSLLGWSHKDQNVIICFFLLVTYGSCSVWYDKIKLSFEGPNENARTPRFIQVWKTS